MLEPAQPHQRRTVLDAFRCALAAVEPAARTAAALAVVGVGSLRVIAAGKAAEGMLRAVLAARGADLVAAVVAAPGPIPADLGADRRLDWHRAGHPAPDQGSLAAGAAVVALVEGAPRDARFLVLLSGGASALLEQPRPGVTLDALRALNQQLLGSGLDIAAVNRERATRSELKAGGLARLLGPRPTDVLFISDVPGDEPRSVGSGPCWLDGDAGSPPRIQHRCIAANSTARAAVAAWARDRGIACVDHGALDGDAEEAGTRIAATLGTAAAGLHLWGGECTVRLPAEHGRGGRCQQLALAAVVAGLAPGCALLACGSDGRDGPGSAAGALVDGTTASRIAEEGLDARAALGRCDAGSVLAAAGELIDTGPTGTNVADLVIAWVGEPSPPRSSARA